MLTDIISNVEYADAIPRIVVLPRVFKCKPVTCVAVLIS